MTHDRTYFRQLSDYDLIDVTRYGDNELALVLAERLDVLLDVKAQLKKAKTEIDDLNLRLDSCVDQALWSLDEIEAMQEMLDAK
jgi:hypothetical protein